MRHLIWTFLWALVIAGLYSVPGNDLPSFSFWDIIAFDKISHFGVFALFTLIQIVGYKKQCINNKLSDKAVLIALVVSITYGGILESIQGMMFENRTSDILDFIANLLGSLAGPVIFRLIYERTGRST